MYYYAIFIFSFLTTGYLSAQISTSSDVNATEINSYTSSKGAEDYCYVSSNLTNEEGKFKYNIKSILAAQRKATELMKLSSENNSSLQGIIEIPVVFHLIASVGTGNLGSMTNMLSNVQRQLNVLNAEFNRDYDFNPHPNWPQAANVEIRFCLAQRDINDNPHGGIVRVNSPRNFLFDNRMEIMESSAGGSDPWDPRSYLNIYVCEIRNSGGIDFRGGFAVLPQEIINLDYDGIVIDYSSFGNRTNVLGVQANGMVAVHEVGHWLGISHITQNFGVQVDCGDEDSGLCCDEDDGFSDTPRQGTLTRTVNIFTGQNYCPEDKDSCPEFSGLDMIENYMDYSGGECKNLFTNQQKAMMRAFFEEGMVRHSILESTGCQAVPPEFCEFDGMAYSRDCCDGIQQSDTELNIDCGLLCKPCNGVHHCNMRVVSQSNWNGDIDPKINLFLNEYDANQNSITIENNTGLPVGSIQVFMDDFENQFYASLNIKASFTSHNMSNMDKATIWLSKSCGLTEKIEEYDLSSQFSSSRLVTVDLSSNGPFDLTETLWIEFSFFNLPGSFDKRVEFNSLTISGCTDGKIVGCAEGVPSPNPPYRGGIASFKGEVVNSSTSASVVNVYPNPTDSNNINILSSSATNVHIYNSNGQVLLGFDLRPGENSLNISSLENGVYYLISSFNKVETRKIVIQR